MLKEIQAIIKDYFLVGIVMMFFTLIIRPFVSIRQSIRDSVIVVVFSVMAGLILENWNEALNEQVRTGITALVGFYSVRLYEISVVMLGKVKENPEYILEKIKK